MARPSIMYLSVSVQECQFARLKEVGVLYACVPTTAFALLWRASLALALCCAFVLFIIFPGPQLGSPFAAHPPPCVSSPSVGVLSC